jgi:hypothetical protein
MIAATPSSPKPQPRLASSAIPIQMKNSAHPIVSIREIAHRLAYVSPPACGFA